MRSLAYAAAVFLALAGTPALATNLYRIVSDYDAVRAALAKDDASPLGPLARTIAAAAEREMKTATGAAATRLASVRDAAVALEKAGGDLAASRAAFAALSKGVLAILASSPTLARGAFVYSCPMVKGYGKWAQATKEIGNPYYGASMLRCAVPATPEP